MTGLSLAAVLAVLLWGTFVLLTGLLYVVGYLGRIARAVESGGDGRRPGRPDATARPAGAAAKVLDTSVIIDGRVREVAAAGFLEGPVIVPRFVIQELQTIADSAEPMKRGRGRRGLDVLRLLQEVPGIAVEIVERDYPEIREVDARLVRLARDLGGALLTNDFNLNKIAALEGVRVLNLNDLANAVKAITLPGEPIEITIVKEGSQPGQGVGYLEDGTMVVVEGARTEIGRTVEAVVSNVHQTSAGRMVFARLAGRGGASAPALRR